MTAVRTHGARRATEHFSSTILLWMRDDLRRDRGIDHWRGPNAEIIAATPGLLEYRQIHLAEHNPGRWPASPGIETNIPSDRKVDGVAEVTFPSIMSPLLGRTQTPLAFADEANAFRRSLLYSGLPGSSRWFDVPDRPTEDGARALVYLRKGHEGEGFAPFVNRELAPRLLAGRNLTELRIQTFLPWSPKLWDSPHVAHDNPADQHLHASVILGFRDPRARDDFYDGADALTEFLTPHVSAIHAYDVETTLTFVAEGEVLPERRRS